jgi:hypothetical protein
MEKGGMSNKQEQADRLHHLLNDRSLLRQKGTTYCEQAIASANLEHQGRFAALSRPTVTGAAPVAYPVQPPSSPWSQGIDQVSSPEPLIDATDCGPRLGYRIDGHPESLVSLASAPELSRSKTSASDAARRDRVALSDPDRGSVALQKPLRRL